MAQQVQVLPYVPSPLEQLSPYIAHAAGALATGLAKRRATTEADKYLEQYYAKNNSSASPENINESISDSNQPAALNLAANGQSRSQTQPPVESSNPFIIRNQSGAPVLDERALMVAESKIAAGKGSEVAKRFVDQRRDEFNAEHKQYLKDQSSMKLKNIERQSNVVQKIQEDSLGKRESIHRQRLDYKIARQAAEEGDVGGFDINWLASNLGPWGEPLKNKSGVQLQSAMKDVLVSNLSKIKGRPNVWIEQQIGSAIPSLGKKAESNEALFDIANANLDIEEKLLDARDNIIQRYESKGIPIPSNIDQLAHESIRDYEEQRTDDLSYDLRVAYEKANGVKSLKPVARGTPLTLEKKDYLLEKFGNDKLKALNYAKKLGYTIPNEATRLRASEG